VVDEVLFHTFEKGEELSLLLSCGMTNPIADVDEEIGDPDEVVLVKGTPKC
jgi:hypothetical protein